MWLFDSLWTKHLSLLKSLPLPPPSTPPSHFLTVNWNFPLFTSPPSPPLPLSSPPLPPLDPPPFLLSFPFSPDPRAKASDLPLCVFFDGASRYCPFPRGLWRCCVLFGEEIASFTTLHPLLPPIKRNLLLVLMPSPRHLLLSL